MARKKTVSVEEENPNLEGLNLTEPETAEEAYAFPEGLPEHSEEGDFPSADTEDAPQESFDGEENDQPDTPPEEHETGEFAVETMEDSSESELAPETPSESTDSPEVSDNIEGPEPLETADHPADTAENPVEDIPEETGAVIPEAPVPVPPQNDRQSFYGLNFNELDRDLTAEERQEWNSIYASYRGRSALTGTIIGADPHSISVRSKETGQMERRTMYCAIVIPYRVRVVIPASEMWEAGHERPDFVLQNMVGATIDFIIIKVDRESGFAIGSRRLAARSQRYFFAHRPSLCREGARLKCRLLSVGPRRCLVECHGHDLNMTQRDLRYTAIPDLRNEYHPGQELDCVVKSYDPEKEALRISVKETESNPFEGAELRHPAGSRRQAVIAGKYGGGVFCNLPDGTVCMCNYSYQHEDSDFLVGDTVILVVQRHEREKRQMYGKILSKW
ncbi:MAG: hypothetical protein HFF90_07595 [Oscillibacter sp.]|nr:hypothetical protein [Oscillibacter sp.]